MSNAKPRFDQQSVKDFEAAIGRKKTTGHATWSFQLHRPYGSSTEEVVYGTFTAAKAHALYVAREYGCTVVSLNS